MPNDAELRNKVYDMLCPFIMKWCGKIELRDSSKKWIKSFCEKYGVNTHIVRVDYPPTTNN